MSHLKFTHRLALLLALLILFPVGAWARAPQAYITNFIDNTVSVIDTATNTVTAPPVPVGQFPQGVAVTPDGKYVYVVNQGDGTVDRDPGFGPASAVVLPEVGVVRVTRDIEFPARDTEGGRRARHRREPVPI